MSAMAKNSRLAPRAGFEPATIRLTVECSTAELPRNKAKRRSLAVRITKPFGLAKEEFYDLCNSPTGEPVRHTSSIDQYGENSVLSWTGTRIIAFATHVSWARNNRDASP